ncbi:MAG: DUF5118 domain-containing protein, partial [Ferruginibacter sp.]|nr:DUF5118 domain-containing protein [Ferruginibacter sp.]
MRKTTPLVLVIITCCLLFVSNSFAQKITIKGKNIDEVIIQTDSTYKPKPKTFYEVLKNKGTHDTGFCIIHKIDNRYYFEIPDTICDKDILIVNRISKAAAPVKPDHS